MFRVGISVRILGREALIVVIVATNDHICTRVVEHLPQCLHLRIIPVRQARTKQRFMKISEGTSSRMLCEILLQPFPLHGRFITAPNLGAFAVQRNDVPLPEIVTVIRLRRITRNSTKIAHVTCRAAAVVLVIPRRRPCPVLEASPGRSVAVSKLFVATIRISQIACRENSSGYLVEQLCRGICTRQIVTTGNIPCAHQNRVGSLIVDGAYYQYFEPPRFRCGEE